MNTSNKVLLILGIFLLTFTVGMILLFWFKEAVPDTLITCVFALSGVEGGVLGWIKTTKEKAAQDEIAALQKELNELKGETEHAD